MISRLLFVECCLLLASQLFLFVLHWLGVSFGDMFWMLFSCLCSLLFVVVGSSVYLFGFACLYLLYSLFLCRSSVIFFDDFLVELCFLTC